MDQELLLKVATDPTINGRRSLAELTQQVYYVFISFFFLSCDVWTSLRDLMDPRERLPLPGLANSWGWRAACPQALPQADGPTQGRAPTHLITQHPQTQPMFPLP